MKSPEEVKAGLAHCVIGPSNRYPRCKGCPYYYDVNCSDKLLRDAKDLIEKMERSNGGAEAWTGSK